MRSRGGGLRGGGLGGWGWRRLGRRGGAGSRDGGGGGGASRHPSATAHGKQVSKLLLELLLLDPQFCSGSLLLDQFFLGCQKVRREVFFGLLRQAQVSLEPLHFLPGQLRLMLGALFVPLDLPLALLCVGCSGAEGLCLAFGRVQPGGKAIALCSDILRELRQGLRLQLLLPKLGLQGYYGLVLSFQLGGLLRNIFLSGLQLRSSLRQRFFGSLVNLDALQGLQDFLQPRLLRGRFREGLPKSLQLWEHQGVGLAQLLNYLLLVLQQGKCLHNRSGLQRGARGPRRAAGRGAGQRRGRGGLTGWGRGNRGGPAGLTGMVHGVGRAPCGRGG
eukprot:RCo051625